MSSISFFKNVDIGLSDAVIYKKYMMVSQWHMYTRSLPFLAHSFQNTGNFLSVGSDKGVFCYMNEVTFGST